MKYTLALLLAGVPLALSVTAPRTWDEAALRDWATPVAGLNVRPGHFSQEEYDRAPIDNLRTYPVYYPGREPAGYWEMLQTVGPKPLIEPSTLNTDEDWIRAGKRVFEEYRHPGVSRERPGGHQRRAPAGNVCKLQGEGACRRHAAGSPVDPDAARAEARTCELRRLSHAHDARWIAGSRCTAQRARQSA